MMANTTNKGLYDLIKRIYSRRYHSVWTCTLGKNQSGKTDWNLRQFEMIHELGLADGFGTNMESVVADFEIELIKDFKTLKARCKMLNPNPDKRGIKRFFFLASELGDFIPRDQPWKNVDFIKELQKVRKVGLSFLSDAIDRVDARVLNENHFHGVFKKYNKGDPTVAKYFDWTRDSITTVKNIPRTTIKFNTYESASFYMEPQNPDDAIVPLNQDHKIVKKYLDAGSWKGAGVHRQEGKRATLAVLDWHFKHCLPAIHEEPQKKEIVESASTD